MLYFKPMKPSRFSKNKTEYVKWGKNIKEVRTVAKTARDAGGPAPLKAEADDAAAQDVYANMAVITHTETEFLLDLIFLPPGQTKARVVKRIIMDPIHTKRLCAALRGNIEKYEARFGPIRL